MTLRDVLKTNGVKCVKCYGDTGMVFKGDDCAVIVPTDNKAFRFIECSLDAECEIVEQGGGV